VGRPCGAPPQATFVQERINGGARSPWFRCGQTWGHDATALLLGATDARRRKVVLRQLLVFAFGGCAIRPCMNPLGNLTLRPSSRCVHSQAACAGHARRAAALLGE
jgi:hypothetical protein